MRSSTRSASRRRTASSVRRARRLRQRHRDHRADHVVRRVERRAPAIGQDAGRLSREAVHVGEDRVEIPLAQERDTFRRGEVARRIAGGLVLELGMKPMAGAPGDDRMMESGLMLGLRPENAARPGRVRPLVQVRRVPVGADGGNVDGDGARRMGAVDQHRHAASVAGGRDRRDRQHERGLRGDVVGHHQLRPRRERRHEGVDDRRPIRAAGTASPRCAAWRPARA